MFSTTLGTVHFVLLHFCVLLQAIAIFLAIVCCTETFTLVTGCQAFFVGKATCNILSSCGFLFFIFFLFKKVSAGHHSHANIQYNSTLACVISF